MRNDRKIALGEQIVAHARSHGFDEAHLQFLDENGELFDTVEEIANNYAPDDSVTIGILLILDQDLTFDLVPDPLDEDAEPIIRYHQ